MFVKIDLRKIKKQLTEKLTQEQLEEIGETGDQQVFILFKQPDLPTAKQKMKEPMYVFVAQDYENIYFYTKDNSELEKKGEGFAEFID